MPLSWNEVLPAERCSYVLGNPPFVGKKEQSAQQKADVAPVFAGINGAGVLDLMAAWYVKAANYLHDAGSANGEYNANPMLVAFVSTNSITQGEQVGVLWSWLLAKGVHIHFAHRTFSWTNEARGKAAVHCVIIGFGLEDVTDKVIYEYDDIKGEPHAVSVSRINPYLTDAIDVFLPNRRESICNAPASTYGSFALDDGQYTLDEASRNALLNEAPESAKFLRPFIGGEELLNGTKRWCLWLKDASPAELRSLPPVMRRVEAVKNWRASRDRETTKSSQPPQRYLPRFANPSRHLWRYQQSAPSVEATCLSPYCLHT